ncbi:MAG: hypothetical protein MAG453_01493 [Calditrichaeota bacterium]|nr:hypothetical protein [Calditrichota bacterium]
MAFSILSPTECRWRDWRRRPLPYFPGGAVNLSAIREFNVRRPCAVFGGGACRDGDDEWELAVEVGARVARAGFTVVTGGYGGVMEAAGLGAKRAGGETAGVLYLPPEQSLPNRYLDRMHVAADYLERMAMLLRPPVAIALPGESGTFAEIAASIALARRHGGRSFAVWAPFWLERLQAVLDLVRAEPSAGPVWIETAPDVSQWLDSLTGS